MNRSHQRITFQRFPSRFLSGFTLVEVLVSTTLLAVVLLVLVNITDQVQKTYRTTQGKTEQFREARIAFESLTRRISQATLNTYWDYNDPMNPTRYQRQSELRFLTGTGSVLLPGNLKTTTHAVFFQAPTGLVSNSANSGLENLLNTMGFYIEFGDDSAIRPGILPASIPLKYRFRLYELVEPAESLSVYKYTSGNPLFNGFNWFRDPLAATPRPARVLATNIVALIIWPKDPQNSSLTTDYNYDTAPAVPRPATQPPSEHQLPPIFQVTMVAIDEASAVRLATANGTSMPAFIQTQWFTESNQAKFDEDMNFLKRQLSGEFNQAEKVNYRIFTSNVSISGAKWSRN